MMKKENTPRFFVALQDLKEHCPLFTFVSAPFQSAVAKLLRDELVVADDTERVPDLGIADPTPDARSIGYKFARFLKE